MGNAAALEGVLGLPSSVSPPRGKEGLNTALADVSCGKDCVCVYACVHACVGAHTRVCVCMRVMGGQFKTSSETS